MRITESIRRGIAPQPAGKSPLSRSVCPIWSHPPRQNFNMYRTFDTLAASSMKFFLAAETKLGKRCSKAVLGQALICARKKAPGKRGSQGGKGRQSFPGANGLLKRITYRSMCERDSLQSVLGVGVRFSEPHRSPLFSHSTNAGDLFLVRSSRSNLKKRRV